MPESTLNKPGANSDTDISALRRAIDEIDDTILDLINKRLGLAQLVGRIKKQGGMRITDSRREKKIVKRLQSANKGPLGTDGLHRIFTAIIDEGRSIQTADRGPQ